MKARLACAALALGLVCALHLAALLNSPQRWLPAAVTLQLKPGQSATLGQAELAAPRAGTHQFTVRRDARGQWWLQNANPAQAAVLRRGDERRHTGSTVLANGQRLHIGAALFQVTAAQDGRVILRGGGHTWTYDGALLLRDDAVQPACPDAGAGARLATYWNRIAPRALGFAHPLAFGGHLHCGNRLATPGLEIGKVTLAQDSTGGIAMTVRGSQPVLVQDGGRWSDAAQREHGLAGLTGIAVGRSAYAVSIADDALRLMPSAQVALSPEPNTELPPGVSWTWKERSLWQFAAPPGTAWVAALAAALFAGLAGWRLAGPTRGAGPVARLAAAVAIVALAVLVLAMQRKGAAPGAAPGAGWPLLLAWAALWHALLWPRRVPVLGVVAVLLLGVGLLVQLELGLGARDTAWLRHVENSCVLLAIGLPLGLLLLQGVARNRVSRPATEWLLVALAVAALAGLVLQVGFGNETGVFDVQPVEFAKLALAALSAHCLALATGGGAPGQRPWRTWLRMIAPALLFVLLLAVALVQVDDFSPLILLLVWAAASFLAWCLASGRRRWAASFGAFSITVLLGAAALQQAAPSLGGFYTERFQVWSDPTAHPHTGQQMLMGARAVADGGWLGADGLFGLATLGQAAGDALRIPAVQDDFAPSFLINRHGLLGGLLVWLLQAALLAALLHAAGSAWQAALRAGDFRRAWLGRFQCFALCGGAAFLAGHFLLSWGTNLALFPIMGQPMSFLSSGGSHLLFFICPLLAFGMASVQSFEESQSCRSTSNTKS
ncbi:FtsW/RodA/SpoVE family cell cycle protein [Telluria aromaticivorans]|uniref:FtsW/RodA/SpoVE family cell cycle protein n=1 Tax=Telluria aromaticivorans TaxID=2725995 RepID=A0A7Y2P063_9BURK|nr:FtsW/RodA/SpoVE family cell cycle protein [Telluria aromaticivorans]NNG23231.1 FtsW/RodA/SpoVE family cell cycle protein [Telluria aromaticivorans]